MEVLNAINYYLDPTSHAPQEIPKPKKIQDRGQDVQRFEAILTGEEEGVYQPKVLVLDTPSMNPNPIQMAGDTLLEKIESAKDNMDGLWRRVAANINTMQDGKINVARMLQLQIDMNIFTMQSKVIAKVGDKVGAAMRDLVLRA